MKSKNILIALGLVFLASSSAFSQSGVTIPTYCGDNVSNFSNSGSFTSSSTAFHWGDPYDMSSGSVSLQSGQIVKYIYFFAEGVENSEFLFKYEKQGEGEINLSFYGLKSKTEVSNKSEIYNNGLMLDQLTVNENKTFSTVKGFNHFMIKLEYKKTGSSGTLFNLKHINNGPDCAFNYVLCESCLPGFSPIPGNEYVLSAWVQQSGYSGSTTNFSQAQIRVQFVNSSGNIFAATDYNTAGEVIDGWQKIEGVVDIPINAKKIQIVLNPTSSITHNYDDIRFFPLDGSMISYVYDQRTLRLVAELDDRNYATLYEYDNEGKLVRVKKETEKGIMTIKESRQSLAKP